MQQTEQQTPGSETKKPKATDSEKEQNTYQKLRDIIISASEKETKSENGRICNSVAKSAIKKFEANKVPTWNEVGNELALFSRSQSPTADEAKKAAVSLMTIYLKLEHDRETTEVSESDEPN